MEKSIQSFKNYLEGEKKMATNSVLAYVRDIREFTAFVADKNGLTPITASEADIAAWLLTLKQEDKTGATVNRKLASLRAYYKFLLATGKLKVNPSVNIKTPKIARKEVEYLTIEEVETLLAQPDDGLLGMRDRAILELLYATGLRVSEVIEANLEDINLRMGFVTCNGEHGKARIIPLGRPARAAMEEYIYEGREKLLRGKEDEEKALFLNYYGGRITRQALWKLIGTYAEKAGIEKKITPQILRNSFAVHMIQNGADIKSLQELMGHEDITATQIFLSVSKHRIKEVYDAAHPRA
ncbi:MAG: tyrosine recombinase [Clostridiales Family XIII bacterium]|jgi:integrase/recombinase XerD|nr:tyrosine recombinase [Clostridiales Family XIII bacterium]